MCDRGAPSILGQQVGAGQLTEVVQRVGLCEAMPSPAGLQPRGLGQAVFVACCERSENTPEVSTAHSPKLHVVTVWKKFKVTAMQ